jgi:hypothetical protein
MKTMKGLPKTPWFFDISFMKIACLSIFEIIELEVL